MNKKTKNLHMLLSYVLTVCMLVGLLPNTAFAEEQVFECGQKLHSHSKECYDENQTLICEIDEHTHTEQCLSQNIDEQNLNIDNTEQNTNDASDETSFDNSASPEDTIQDNNISSDDSQNQNTNDVFDETNSDNSVSSEDTIQDNNISSDDSQNQNTNDIFDETNSDNSVSSEDTIQDNNNDVSDNNQYDNDNISDDNKDNSDNTYDGNKDDSDNISDDKEESNTSEETEQDTIKTDNVFQLPNKIIQNTLAVTQPPTEEHTLQPNEKIATDEHGEHDENDGWIPIDNSITKITTGGKYFLLTDRNQPIKIESSEDVILCLDGKESTFGISVYSNTKVTVCDCKGEGKISGLLTKNSSEVLIKNGEIAHVQICDDSKFTMNNGTISNGRGVEVNNNGEFIMNGGTISNGWGVKVNSNGKFIMNDGIISNNYIRGVTVNDSAIFTMNNGTISENTIENGNGAGVYLSKSSKFTMNGGTISKNITQNGNGAGVYVDSSSEFTMNGGTISENIAENGDGGGVFALKDSNFNIDNNSIISKNTAINGGGICIYNTPSTYDNSKGNTFTINNSIISENIANKQGGGIYLYDTILKMSNCTINKNKTTENTTGDTNYGGGGIKLSGKSVGKDNAGAELTIEHSAINENTSLCSGGGIDVFLGTSIINDSIISENTAECGGGVQQFFGTFIMNNSTITNNHATSKSIYDGGGGGVSILGQQDGKNDFGTFIMNGGTISENTASDTGGGVWMERYSLFVINGGKIIKNTASNTGGGIWLLGNLVISDEVVIDKNTSNNIYLNDKAKINKIEVNGKLTGGEKSIGVTLETPSENKTIAQGKDYTITEADSKVFKSDDINYTTKYQSTDNTVILVTAPDKYIVTFYTGEDTTAPNEQQITPGEKAHKPNDPTKDGYKFLGWFVDVSGTNPFDFNTPITADTTLTAKWQEIRNFTVSFNTDGGSPVPAQQNVNDGEKAHKPDDPTKDGYKFLDWFVDVSGTNPFDFNTPITADTILTAKWQEIRNFTVSFNTDGGSPVPAQQNVNDGEKAHKPDDPTKDGYKFLGWFVDVSGTNPFDFNTPITADTTLTAKWQELPPNQKVVTFNSNGGTTINPTTVNAGQKVSKPDDPTKQGHKFLGWFVNANDTNPFDFENTPVTVDITLTAKWQKNQYTVTFYIDGEVKHTQDIDYNDTATKPNDPTKEGYTFDGWYTDNTFTTKYNFSTLVTQNTNVYAKWSEVKPNPDDPNKPVEPDDPNKPMEPDTPDEPSKPSTPAQPAHTYSIGGTVTYSNGTIIPNAIITTTGASTTTDNNGKFVLSHLSSGTYYITANVNGKIVSKTVILSNADVTVNIVIAMDNVSTEVNTPSGEVSTDIDVENIIINGLDTEAENYSQEGNSVKLSLTIQPQKQQSNNNIQNDITKIAKRSEIEFLEITLQKVVNGNSSTEITDTENTLEIIVPCDTSDKQNITVCRYYNGKVSRLQKLSDAPITAQMLSREANTTQDGTFYVEENSIHIYTNKMAYYAIAYDTKPYKTTKKHTSSSGGGGRSGSWTTQQNTTKATNTTEYNVVPNIDVAPVQNNNIIKNTTSTLAQFTDINSNEWYYDAVKYCIENNLMSGTSSTTFEPNAAMTRAMVIEILWRMENEPIVDYAMTFTDIAENAYYKDAIIWAVSKGIISGYDIQTFAPNHNITREQMVSILYRYTQYKNKDVSRNINILNYQDKNEISNYALTAIQWACDTGIINGISTTILSPKGTTTRAQTAQIFKEYLEKQS